WPAGLAKKGHFHLLGHAPQWVVLLAEGYATAATLFEATGLPVVCAFDASNLMPVAEALRKRYKRARILVCADDDLFGSCQHRFDDGKRCIVMVVLTKHPTTCPQFSQPHRCYNAFMNAAGAVAVAACGAWLKPSFDVLPARREKLI